MVNPYESLGVASDATKADIKRAWRKLAKEHHPDKGGNEEKFKEIQAAYELLTDDERRKQYDTYGGTDKPKDTTQRARQTIAQTFTGLLQQSEAHPYIDYVSKMATAFKNQKAQCEEKRSQLKQHVNRCEKLLKKTEGELLRGVIQSRLNTCQGQLTQIEEQLEVTAKCLGMLKGCKCGEDVERARSPRSARDRFVLERFFADHRP